MSKRNFLFSAALPFLAFGLATTASAQQAPPTDQVVTTPVADVVEDDAAAEDEIVVTGSRIKRTEFEGALPGSTVTAEYLENRSFTNVIDAFRELPFAAIGSSSRGGNVQFGDSNNFVDLLGLGSQRTLTLLNGRRFVSANQATVFVPGNLTGAQVDLGVIPTGLIERVETRVGGGGAVYGADAVSGVNNLILKEDYDGLEAFASGGFTDAGGGQDYRISLLAGKNFNNNRTNVTASFEYIAEAILNNDSRRPFTQFANLANSADFGIRSRDLTLAPLTGSVLGVPNAFLALGTNNVPSSLPFFAPRNPALSQGGVITTLQTIGSLGNGTTTAQLIPAGPVSGALAGSSAAALAVCGSTFVCFAPSSLPSNVTAASVIAAFAPGSAPPAGLSPTEFALQLLQANRPSPREFFASRPNLNPLLFVGSFGAAGVPRIANTNAATAGLFPFIAAPLQFGPNGQIIPFNYGELTPTNPGTPVGVIGGDGFYATPFTQLRSGQDRFIGNLLVKHDITSNIKYNGEFLVANITTNAVGAPTTNAFTGSNAGAARAIPIRNDNAFLDAADRAALAASGILAPTTVGADGRPNPFFFLNRAHVDLVGSSPQGNTNRTYRIANALSGEFNSIGRDFNWDVSFVYGRATNRNANTTIDDVAFALASDAVINPATGQAVCRQQLTGPRPLGPDDNVFLDPGGPFGGAAAGSLITPTQAQIDACQPLNLFGDGAPSAAARDYVVAFSESTNVSQQYYAAAQFGGDILKLPAGDWDFSAQFEWRRESNAFSPSAANLDGAFRNAPLVNASGQLRYFEGGFETLLPIFGDKFNVPLFRRLALEGAVRVVNQNISGTAVTFTAGGSWSPVDWVTFRGNRNRSVRSPSVVESQGAPQQGFFGAGAGPAFHPCDADNIASDEAGTPGARRANCRALVQSLGIANSVAAADAFLSTFQAEQVAILAIIGPNAELENEQSEAFTTGVEIRPPLIPGLQLGADYIDLRINQAIQLANIAVVFQGCFDNFSFPNTPQFASNLCNLISFETSNSARLLQINQLGVPNLNLATQTIKAINANIRYAFDLPNNAGRIELFGTGFYRRELTDTSGSLPTPGEIGAERFTTRFDTVYRIGKFNTLLQWQRVSRSFANDTGLATPDDQPAPFFRGPVSVFNSSTQYDVNDNVRLLFTVNNFTNSLGPAPGANIVNNPLGRTFVAAVRVRF